MNTNGDNASWGNGRERSVWKGGFPHIFHTMAFIDFRYGAPSLVIGLLRPSALLNSSMVVSVCHR